MPGNGDELPLNLGIFYDTAGAFPVEFIGNFHKTLPHNKFGEVNPADYQKLMAAADPNPPPPPPPVITYENVPAASVTPPLPEEAGYRPGVAPASADRLNNPQAARFQDRLSGGPAAFTMGPAPKVLSLSTAAEMTELQWMALLRDKPFSEFTPATLQPAITDLTAAFTGAVAANDPGGLKLGEDLPAKGNNAVLDLRPETLFRCGLPGEDKGPIISQFFLHDIAYGAQFIVQKVRPYAKEKDFLTDHGSWLRAQNAGLDEWGHGYSGDNDFIDAPELEDRDSLFDRTLPPRRISTMRDLARFVNKDALHQAYFNAALLCLSWGVGFDKGSPYAAEYTRQVGFATFGGPELLTRVSEVASRALAIVWRQKWEVHRRLRPEAYGGLMQMQAVGLPEPGGAPNTTRAYGLPPGVFTTAAAQQLMNRHGGYYLPIAFTAGSPVHPAYGAGHATVAGACVTVLKAWLDEKQALCSVMSAYPGHRGARHPLTDAPVPISTTDAAGNLVPYTGADKGGMTVEGELNKIACNVAMGRSMGGVHWRSDNTRSLRLGEQIAAAILASESTQYAERGTGGAVPTWSFTSFSGKQVVISGGAVLVNGAAVSPTDGPL